MLTNLDAMFNPHSVAVIGASNDPLRVGYRPIQNCLKFGFQGKLFPINPKYSEVAGIPCYPSLDEVKEDIDLVVITVPVAQVMKALETCAKKGVKAVVIYSSGFAEVGGTGKQIQDQMKAFIRSSGLRVCGPNCQGIANLHTGMNASFSTCFLRYSSKPGSLGLVSQSGLVGGIIYPMGLERGLGFSHWVSMGNGVDLDFADCVSYMAQDENTRIILGYLENIQDSRKLQRAIQEAHQQGKPVVVVLSGRTEVGAQAVSSHTGSLAVDDRLVDAILRQIGVLRVYDLQELIDSADLLSRVLDLSKDRSRLPKGKRVAMITNSGGSGVMMADTCIDLGLEVTSFSQELQDRVAQIIPAFGSPRNPIDMSLAMMDQPEVLPKTVRLLDQEGAADTIIIFLGMMGGNYPLDKIVPDIINLSQTVTKPLIVTWMVGVQEAFQRLQAAGVPVFEDPTRCLKSLTTLIRYAERIVAPDTDSDTDIQPVETHRLNFDTNQLDEYVSKKLLADYGIPSCKEILTHSEEEAVCAAEEMGYPVVLKACSADIPHKSELGLVKISLSNSDDVKRAYQALVTTVAQKASQARLEGILVQEMVKDGVELALGVIHEPRFGPVIMCGLGGIFIEVLKDVSWRMAPVTPSQARSMLQELKGYPLLAGVRGRPPADMDALTDAIVRLSHLAVGLSDQVKEIDLNPLMVLSQRKGVKAVDALVVLRR
jgi:acetyltransferase